jgi:hypothetical protein
MSISNSLGIEIPSLKSAPNSLPRPDSLGEEHTSGRIVRSSPVRGDSSPRNYVRTFLSGRRSPGDAFYCVETHKSTPTGFQTSDRDAARLKVAATNHAQPSASFPKVRDQLYRLPGGRTEFELYPSGDIPKGPD